MHSDLLAASDDLIIFYLSLFLCISRKSSLHTSCLSLSVKSCSSITSSCSGVEPDEDDEIFWRGRLTVVRRRKGAAADRRRWRPWGYSEELVPYVGCETLRCLVFAVGSSIKTVLENRKRKKRRESFLNLSLFFSLFSVSLHHHSMKTRKIGSAACRC